MTNPRKQRPLLASFWMMGALLSISGMAIAGRELSSELNAFQISFTRDLLLSTGASLVILIFIGFHKVKQPREVASSKEYYSFWRPDGMAVWRGFPSTSRSFRHRIYSTNLDRSFGGNISKRTPNKIPNVEYSFRICWNYDYP